MIAKLRLSQYWLMLLGLVLSWPAFVNGSPFLFADTPSYMRAADAVVLSATGMSTSWSNDDVRGIVNLKEKVSQTASQATNRSGISNGKVTKPVLLGRSIYYGLFIYTCSILGSLWYVVALQTLFVSSAIFGVLRHIVSPASHRTFAIACMLVFILLSITPLPYFCSMIMPDIFAATTIIAAAVIIVGWQRERWIGRVYWAVVALYGGLVHSSHVLILGTIACGALLLAFLLSQPVRAKQSLIVLTLTCVALLGEVAFSRAVLAATGEAPIRPPFATARLVEDGPGFHFIQKHCEPAEFVLCKFRDRLPLPSDEFLWRTDRTGVFKAASTEDQRGLAAEQGKFVWAVVADRPVEVIGSTLNAVGRQLTAWRMSEFNQTPPYSLDLAMKLPVNVRNDFVRSASFSDNMPTGLVTALVPVWMVLGLAASTLLLRRKECAPSFPYIAILVSGWAINVFFCGAFSTPHDRYQTRVIWLIALSALVVIIEYVNLRVILEARSRPES